MKKFGREVNVEYQEKFDSCPLRDIQLIREDFEL